MIPLPLQHFRNFGRDTRASKTVPKEEIEDPNQGKNQQRRKPPQKVLDQTLQTDIKIKRPKGQAYKTPHPVKETQTTQYPKYIHKKKVNIPPKCPAQNLVGQRKPKHRRTWKPRTPKLKLINVSPYAPLIFISYLLFIQIATLVFT